VATIYAFTLLPYSRLNGLEVSTLSGMVHVVALTIEGRVPLQFDICVENTKFDYLSVIVYAVIAEP